MHGRKTRSQAKGRSREKTNEKRDKNPKERERIAKKLIKRRKHKQNNGKKTYQS